MPLLAARLAYSSTLKLEAVRSSETSVNFHHTKRRHIPKDVHCRENLKSNMQSDFRRQTCRRPVVMKTEKVEKICTTLH
jgi:hypothetical protein